MSVSHLSLHVFATSGRLALTSFACAEQARQKPVLPIGKKRRKYLHRPVSNVFSRKLTKDFHLSPDVGNETLLHQHTAATNNLAKCGEGLPFWLVRTACLLLTYYECKHSRASEASGGMRCAWLMH